MSTMGTFDAFNTARLGIYAAQQGFMVTGNNISNINTVGYTRQRLDQVSFKAGAYDRYRSQLDNRIGSGALVMNINQVRDPYLDVRYRNTAADVGYNDTLLAGLQSIASILDEVGVGDDTNVNKKGDGRLQAQLQAVSDALRKFAADPTKENNDLVRKAADTLCGIFNSYATKLENFYNETKKDFTDKVTKINEHLANIRDLNDEIRDNEIFGDNALELRDERNRQIDELSQLIHIKVIYSEESIGNGRTVEKLSIYLDDDNPDPAVRSDESLLIDGVFGSQISSPKMLPMLNPDYNPNATEAELKAGDHSVFKYLTNEQLKQTDPNDPNAPEKLAFYDKDGKIVYYVKDDPASDGLAPVMKGTNNIEDAVQVENDYYTIQIGKLYDDHGVEWEGRTTEWTQVATDKPALKETQKVTLTSANWNPGDTFLIGDQEYTISNPNATPPVLGAISADDMNDAEKLAAFLAPKLSAANTEYVITADGADLVYTARKAGAVGPDGNGPSAIPTAPTFTPGNTTAGTITFGNMTQTQAGQESEPVKMKDENGKDIEPGITTYPDGSQTIVTYRQKVDGTWFCVTTEVKHTAEVVLDDNDLYGSLQATRELLTEAGEFTTEDVLNKVDEGSTGKRGIPYYQLSLDLMAKKFAEVYNQLNQGIALDQNGDPIKSTTPKEIPALKVEADGTVSKWIGPGPNDYSTADGWKADDKKYCVKDGFYTGLHGDANGNGCIIYQKIPVAQWDGDKIKNYEAVFEGLKKTNFDNATCMQIEVEADPDKKAEMVKDLLTSCLASHGVNLNNIPPVDPNKLPDPSFTVETEDVKMGGPLFSNRGDRNDTDGITAANISVSKSWSDGDVELVPKFEILWDGDIQHSTQNKNADHMVSMLDPSNIILFNPKDLVPDAVSDKLFSGSFNGLYNGICTTLGEDRKAANLALNMHYTQLIEIDTNRDGVSGVDLNDEAMNMMQYQKAYSAACRLMTVVDEALDRLINNTAI